MDGQLMDVMKELADFKEAKGKFESNFKTIFNRLDKQDALLDTIRALAGSVDSLARAQEEMRTDIQEMRSDVEDIKSKAARRAAKIMEKAVYAAVGILVGYVLKMIGIV